MRSFCPRCGNVRGHKAMIVSFSVGSVWSRCSNCDGVWRSSLLRTILGYAVGTISVWRPTQELAAYIATATAPEAPPPAYSPDLDALMNLGDLERSIALNGPSPDRLNAEVEDLLDGLDAGVVPERAQSHWDAVDDASVEAFFDSFAQDSSRPLRAARVNTRIMEAGAPAIRPSPVNEDISLVSSADRMLKNVDSVCESFERLGRQFADLERCCENLC